LKSSWRIISRNEEKLLFSALSLLVHFIELFYGINRESLLSDKLFDRAPAEFSRESAMEVLSNGALVASAAAWLRATMTSATGSMGLCGGLAGLFFLLFFEFHL